MPHHAPPPQIDVWSVEGRFQHLIYSPKGTIEGLLIDTDGVPTQFVCDGEDPMLMAQLGTLTRGQALVVEGTEADASPKGEPEHTVYRLERLASIDGHAPAEAQPDDGTEGTVLRFNHARHGAANGVVLDSGDFVHTRPDGLAALGLKIGDRIVARGPARPLATGPGRVIEAHSVNGKPVARKH